MKAKAAYPEDDLYAKWEVDVLIATDKLDEAVKGLEAVIAAGSADAQTYTQLAYLALESRRSLESTRSR